jgi:biopolymer transport protein ExbD
MFQNRGRKQKLVDEHLDMTAMVDVVFQLMTFLLLTYQASTESVVNVPAARYGVGVEEADSVLLTVAPPKGDDPHALVYLGKELDPKLRLEDSEAINLAVEQGLADGKRRVVIQADAEVPHGEVLRIAGAAGRVQGVTLHIGIKDEAK